MLGVGTVRGEPRAGTSWDSGVISGEDRAALAVLTSVHRLGPVTMTALFAAIGSPSVVLELAARPDGARALSAMTPPGPDGRSDLPKPVADAIHEAAVDRDRILRGIDRLGLRTIAIGDPEYPLRLRAIDIPPLVLFLRGDPRAFAAEHAVAVVGTRRPTDSGRRNGSRIAGAIARAGGLVVSGLAIGIDGAAHAAAVMEGRPTVAFIGSGHGRLFPPVHDRLADAIVDAGGAVVSEYSPETEANKGTFPRRNRLISGSADAVVVVEAGARSGALLTASWALEQGRDCFVVPGPLDAPASAGCLGFLREWPDIVRVVAGVPQLLEDLGMAAREGLERPKPAPRHKDEMITSKLRAISPAAALAAMPAEDRPVAQAILDGATIVDEIVSVTGRPVGAVLGTLTRLETAGIVVARHGRYQVSEALAGAA
jgi:DNA processing protein